MQNHPTIRFEWDTHKAKSNLEKHGVSFETARKIFDDPLHVSVQDRHAGGEERWISFGLVEGILILAVAHTVREADDQTVIRIISARKATSIERKHYEEGR